ncbi:TPA: hypothetical protein KEP04_000748 [Enterococcus faecalis]|nr:hypothetical protein [Enterococcus faecalis]
MKEKAVNMSNLTKCKKDLFEIKSVVFKDISKQQSEKAQKRKRLLQLMNQYPDWASQKNKLIMQEIQELGQAIGNWSMDQSRPIQSIKAASFTKSEYLYLIWLGYSDEAIRHGLDMSKECYFIYRLTLLNE